MTTLSVIKPSSNTTRGEASGHILTHRLESLRTRVADAVFPFIPVESNPVDVRTGRVRVEIVLVVLGWVHCRALDQ
jgi:hypothetical protein